MVADDLNRISLKEYWNISRTEGTDAVDITFHFKDIERSEVDTSSDGLLDLTIGHWNSAGYWEDYNGEDALLTGTALSITAKNVTAFSPLAPGFKSPPAALPVELISFEAKRNNNEVEVLWATAAEINNEKFEIQRSYDGKSFDLVHVEYGQGNSFGLTNYEFVDNDVVSHIVYYRLKQVDFDGTFTYSDVVVVVTSDSDIERAIDVYPNPNTGNLIFLKATDNLGDFARARLLTSSGVLVTEVSNLFISSKTYSAISIENKPNPGVYFLEISGQGNTVYKKVIFK